MIISYNDFVDVLEKHLQADNDEYKKLLDNICNNIYRFTGLFRSSNAKIKLIQHMTQSREIRFGDFLEEIIEQYLHEVGFVIENKSFDGNELVVDQLFSDSSKRNVYLVEQKVRDDHDSTKKRGQFTNFERKARVLKDKFKESSQHAYMYFIDPSIVKNKNYYAKCMQQLRADLPGIEMELFYGKDFFNHIGHGVIWEELCTYLKNWRSCIPVSVPDYDLDKSDTAFLAMTSLNEKQLTKLLSSEDAANLIRKELFSSNTNFDRLYEHYLLENNAKMTSILGKYLGK